MPSVKRARRPQIDYPSGRGTGLPAAGVHAVDRKLGATPTDFRLQGASGQPSASADSGYSRTAVQRVNKGYEEQKSLEDIPEISWLKQNAERLNSMGLTPRVVVEMYRALNEHRPRNEQERAIIAEMNRRVLRTRREIRTVTRLALLESHSARRIDEFDIGSIGSLASAGMRHLNLLGGDGAQEKGTEVRPSEDQEIEGVLKTSDPDLSGDPITRSELEAASQEDLTAGVLSCNTSSLEIFQTFLAVTGVVGDIGSFFGIPVGIAADLINSCINLVCGNYFYAMLDLFAVVPFAGDLGKILYAKRLTKTLGLVEDMAVLKSAKNFDEQVAAADSVFDKILKDQRTGAKTSKILLGLKRVFGSAEKMSDRLGNFLKRVIGRAITFLEGVQKSAAEGSIVSKAVAWIFTKLPLDVLKILKKIQAEGVPAIKEFIVKLFGRKGAQQTAAVAQARHAVLSHTGETQQAGEVAPMEPGPYDEYLKGEMGSYYTAFEDVNRDGIPDDEQPDVVRMQSTAPSTSPYLREGVKRKKSKTRAKRDLSLTKALAGDDSAIDETSTVATSLGPAGKVGAGGYIIPLGMKPSGSRRKSLDSLIPGYEFATGRYPYSR